MTDDPPRTWTLSDAQRHFDDVLRKALEEEPQRIEHQGETVVVLSDTEYRRLMPKKRTFIEFLLSAPDLSDLDFERDATSRRDIEP